MYGLNNLKERKLKNGETYYYFDIGNNLTCSETEFLEIEEEMYKIPILEYKLKNKNAILLWKYLDFNDFLIWEMVVGRIFSRIGNNHFNLTNNRYINLLNNFILGKDKYKLKFEVELEKYRQEFFPRKSSRLLFEYFCISPKESILMCESKYSDIRKEFTRLNRSNNSTGRFKNAYQVPVLFFLDDINKFSIYDSVNMQAMYKEYINDNDENKIKTYRENYFNGIRCINYDCNFYEFLSSGIGYILSSRFKNKAYEHFYYNKKETTKLLTAAKVCFEYGLDTSGMPLIRSDNTVYINLKEIDDFLKKARTLNNFNVFEKETRFIVSSLENRVNNTDDLIKSFSKEDIEKINQLWL